MSLTFNETIRRNLSGLEARISAACTRGGRTRESVTLVGVSKTFPASLIDDAVACGVSDIGENRVQELRDKQSTVASRPRWHLIGHIQSNKAKLAAQIADVIHTVDSPALAKRLANAAADAGRSLEVLIQVNVGGEEQKSGVSPDAAEDLVLRSASLAALRVRGLMTIPPVGSPEETRPYFIQLRELRDRIVHSTGGDIFTELSMGMSDDFEVAIEEGATMIRVGRALFGGRG
jgi:hypothetical protein